ncbi:hypothetical protein GCM10011384_43590 [Psychrobacillus lasiicapitis]|nr:hypothetical protein GCM10011384_43590 [Psychrobacillus lasiicapitis]
MLRCDLSTYENWILSGAICGWGDSLNPILIWLFFLEIPKSVRLQRLQQREFQRYGNDILVGGS